MPNTVDFYLSKGFDKKMAEYFASGRKKIVSVQPKDDFSLLIEFDNKELRIFDVKPFLKADTVFEQFMNLSDFKRVYLDRKGITRIISARPATPAEKREYYDKINQAFRA